MSILRDINRAKTLLKAVGNINQRIVPSGTAVVKQGERGDSMYTVVTVRSVVADYTEKRLLFRVSMAVRKKKTKVGNIGSAFLAIFGHMPVCHTDNLTSLCSIKRGPGKFGYTLYGRKPTGLLGRCDFPCSIMPYYWCKKNASAQNVAGVDMNSFPRTLRLTLVLVVCEIGL